ncbi:MAG TPA: hypothetical protein VFA91_08980 [Candidatus Polarisedimenticolia bacterium]|nr:hypothetical protein [Dongiaceae bacterium]HYV88699.1 hypothetical protein [Candidatus Polarisedimenticolia bacterium]
MKSCTEPAVPMFNRFGLFAIILLLGACGNTARAPGNVYDGGYYNFGNCSDSGRVGYARDYSYGERYLSGQNRAC